MSNLGDSFYSKLLQVASVVSMQPEDLLLVMSLESGVNPSAHNKDGGASGLIQFMPRTLENLGYIGHPSQFRNLSGTQQLQYVEKYILNMMKYNGGPFKSATQYYVANFLPVALKLRGVQSEDPKTIIIEENPKTQKYKDVSIDFEKKIYNSNRGLDSDGDGKITYGDLQKVLSKINNSGNFSQVIADLKNQTGYNAKKPNIENNKFDDITDEELKNLLTYKKQTPFEGKNINVVHETLENLLKIISSNNILFRKLKLNNIIK
jgi:hypothetical protein